MFHNLHFLQTDMAFGIINYISRIFDTVSSSSILRPGSKAFTGVNNVLVIFLKR